MGNDYRNIFTKNINRIMKEKGKKPAQIAKDLNYPLSTVSSWTNGKSYPRVDKMQELADYLHVSMKDLTDEKTIDIHQPFTSLDDAMLFLIKSPVASAYGGYDLDKMSEEEIIDFANELSGIFKVIAERRKK